MNKTGRVFLYNCNYHSFYLWTRATSRLLQSYCLFWGDIQCWPSLKLLASAGAKERDLGIHLEIHNLSMLWSSLWDPCIQHTVVIGAGCEWAGGGVGRQLVVRKHMDSLPQFKSCSPWIFADLQFWKGKESGRGEGVRWCDASSHIKSLHFSPVQNKLEALLIC